jgi:hypothetical protein
MVAPAVLGLAAYGAYNLTNLAIVRGWPLELSLIDWAWGGIVSALAGRAGWWALASRGREALALSRLPRGRVRVALSQFGAARGRPARLTLPTSSATSSAPVLSIATPTGRRSPCRPG